MLNAVSRFFANNDLQSMNGDARADTFAQPPIPRQPQRRRPKTPEGGQYKAHLAILLHEGLSALRGGYACQSENRGSPALMEQ